MNTIISHPSPHVTSQVVLNGDTLGLPGAVLFTLFLGGAVCGTVTLAIAMWRSPLVPGIVVVFTLEFAVLDFALGQGVFSHLVNLVGFVIVAGVVVVGYTRQPYQRAQLVAQEQS